MCLHIPDIMIILLGHERSDNYNWRINPREYFGEMPTDSISGASGAAQLHGIVQWAFSSYWAVYGQSVCYDGLADGWGGDALSGAVVVARRATRGSDREGIRGVGFELGSLGLSRCG